jgi:predicted alpha/beta superfamily hydrolase
MATVLNLHGIEVQSLHSEILNRDLVLYIKLPWSYERSDKVYPVLYCTDANRSFFIYSTMSLIFETPGPDTPEILMVGIGYRLDTNRIIALTQYAAWRTHDLTPINRPEIDQFWVDKLSSLLAGEAVEVNSGGSHDFLICIREEIIPYIEANYRGSSTDRGLAGYSYGGLFTLYALFHAPELFQRWFAGSPTMWQQVYEEEENYASSHKDLPAKLFITAGTNETELLEEVQPLVEHLRSRGYPGLDLTTHKFEGEGHASAYAASVSRALSELYNEDWRKT